MYGYKRLSINNCLLRLLIKDEQFPEFTDMLHKSMQFSKHVVLIYDEAYIAILLNSWQTTESVIKLNGRIDHFNNYGKMHKQFIGSYQTNKLYRPTYHQSLEKMIDKYNQERTLDKSWYDGCESVLRQWAYQQNMRNNGNEQW